MIIVNKTVTGKKYNADMTAAPFTLKQRASGVLLHPTSLPGPHGIGDLGPAAHRFAKFLAAARQRWWQMLPVCPPGAGNSPYAADSSFAGSPLLVSLEDLQEWLDPEDLRPGSVLGRSRVDYSEAWNFKMARQAKAFDAFERRAGSAQREALDRFCVEERSWLEDYSLFAAIKESHRGVPWPQWEAGLRSRDPAAMAKAAKQLAPRIRFHRFVQYQFHLQWERLRGRCRGLGIGLMGDLPIYVAHDSAEVWAHQELFALDAGGMPAAVAGVPPDYFSATGQLWGNPIYRWDKHRQTGYDWWIRRLRHGFTRFDAIRMDHFIGFQRYWEVPAHARTAEHGRWMEGPGADFFETVLKALGPVELAAEDLGVLTPDARALRDRFQFPGMRVLQFAFSGGPSNEHLPHHYPQRCIAYTGTHDNDTSAGWRQNASAPDCAFARQYLGESQESFPWQLLRLAWMSVADIAVAPAQDLLASATQARMNTPGTASGNWEWRLADEDLDDRIARKLAEMTYASGRAVDASRPPIS